MNNWIVDLNQKEQARGTALVFVPHAGGGPNAFRSVAREIRRKLPVLIIAAFSVRDSASHRCACPLSVGVRR